QVAVRPALQGGGGTTGTGGPGTKGGDDDAPILVAGGSLYLGTLSHFQLTKDGDDKLLFDDLKDKQVERYVWSIDTVDSDDKESTYASDQTKPAKIVVKYSGNETITLQYDPVSHYITISNKDNGGHPTPIKARRHLLSNLRY